MLIAIAIITALSAPPAPSVREYPVKKVHVPKLEVRRLPDGRVRLQEVKPEVKK